MCFIIRSKFLCSKSFSSLIYASSYHTNNCLWNTSDQKKSRNHNPTCDRGGFYAFSWKEINNWVKICNSGAGKSSQSTVREVLFQLCHWRKRGMGPIWERVNKPWFGNTLLLLRERFQKRKLRNRMGDTDWISGATFSC